MNIFEIDRGFYWVWDGKTRYPYRVDPAAAIDTFKYSPETVYLYCKWKNMTGEETIDFMLQYFHKRRIVKVGHLAGLSLCVVLIGVRGSGKSVGATQIGIVDGLLAGRKVVSNMPIQIKVKYKDAEKVFETEDLDAVTMLDINEFNTNYEDCLILIDESNLNVADALRSTTNQALFFAMILQQMRHRKLDFVMTTQDEGFNTKRTRSQVDLYIRCKDKAMVSKDGARIRPKIGELGRKSEWSLYDMSGVITGEIKRADTRTGEIVPYRELTAWNTPFWHCYSTKLMQRWEKLKFDDNKETIGKLDTEYLKELVNQQNVVIKAVISVIRENITEIKKADLWKLCGIEDRSSQTTVGQFLTGQLGFESNRKGDGYYYIFPNQAEMIKRLADIGIDMDF